MPSTYTPQQKGLITQFVGFTSTKDSVAAKVRSPQMYIPTDLLHTEDSSNISVGKSDLLILLPEPQVSRMEPRASTRYVCISTFLIVASYSLRGCF